MYYSEKLGSAITYNNVKKLYGVDPETDAETAQSIGIYSVTELPEGYSASHYLKIGDTHYEAVPNIVSDNEVELVNVIRATRGSVSAEELGSLLSTD